jgi:hypothetical protein
MIELFLEVRIVYQVAWYYNTYNSFYTNFLFQILYFVEHPLPLMSNECQHVWDVVSTNPYTKYICRSCNLNHPPPLIYNFY